MTIISTEDMQNDVAGLLERLERGEAFLIERGSRPLGRLEPVIAQVPDLETRERRERAFGSLAGTMQIPDDFNEMMRDEIEEMFYGKP